MTFVSFLVGYGPPKRTMLHMVARRHPVALRLACGAAAQAMRFGTQGSSRKPASPTPVIAPGAPPAL
jgi:hypothetical protein